MKMTRWISLILCLAMLSTLVAFPVWAEGTGEQFLETAEAMPLTEDGSEDWDEVKRQLSAVETEEDTVSLEEWGIEELIDTLEEGGKTRSSQYYESEPNNSRGTANRVYSDYTVGGTLSSSDLLDYYKITLSTRSKLTIASASTKSTTIFGVWDAADECVAASFSLGMTDGYYGQGISQTFPAGTYYVCVLDSRKASSVYGISFRVGTADSSGSTGGDSTGGGGSSSSAGSTMSQAVNTNFNKTYSHTWTSNQNYYLKFTMPQRGIVTLKLNKAYDSSGEAHQFKIYFLDKDGNVLYGNECFRASESAKEYYEVNCGLEAGTYYLQLAGLYLLSSESATAEYTLSYTANAYCEIESNESAAQATALTLGREYRCFFGRDGYSGSTEDYYCFEVTEGHNYRITIDEFANLSSTTTMLYLIGEKQNTIHGAMKNNIDDQGRNYFDFSALTSGTYYLRFTNYGSQQYGFTLRVDDLSLDLYRISGSDRWNTAIRTANEMKSVQGVSKFNTIIVASGNDSADALAGSYLSTIKNAPILLSWGKGGKYDYLDTNNINYIKNNLVSGGTVYLLGGTGAVPSLYESNLSGYNVCRLGGANRFETNLKILEEAGVDFGSEILVCTAYNFADSLSASAAGKPILLVYTTDNGKTYGVDDAYLQTLDGCQFTIIGGESAVSADVQRKLESYGIVERLAGGNRFETSVLVAERFFDAPDSAVLAYAWNYPDGLCGGALAYAMHAPLILTMDKWEGAAAQYVQSNGITSGIILGGTGLISDAAVRTIYALDPSTQIPLK